MVLRVVIFSLHFNSTVRNKLHTIGCGGIRSIVEIIGKNAGF
jgi:hypothetical protein